MVKCQRPVFVANRHQRPIESTLVDRNLSAFLTRNRQLVAFHSSKALDRGDKVHGDSLPDHAVPSEKVRIVGSETVGMQWSPSRHRLDTTSYRES